MEMSTSYFATCSKAETMLLEELAKEHRGNLTIKRIETPHSMQIVIETTSQQLRDFIYFMLQKLRSNQKAFQKCHGLPPVDVKPKNTVELATEVEVPFEDTIVY